MHASRSEVARAWSNRRTSAQRNPRGHAPEDTEALCARLDEAFSILSDPEQSKRYRTYVSQQREDAPPLDPEDFLHPPDSEWSTKSTASPAPALRSPRTLDANLGTDVPPEPPPWLGERPANP